MDQQQSFQGNFDNENAFLQNIGAPKQSQPTKNKVSTFKTRVFRLLRIYAEKSKDINPLLKSINKDIFFKQPQKVNEIILILLNKKNISGEQLKKLAYMYQGMLLFKEKKQSKNSFYAETFIKMLKKMQPAIGVAMVQEMLETFALKRKCKLKVEFFFYLLRKISGFRQPLLDKIGELGEKSVRPAQKKQLEKIEKKINRKENIIKEQN